MPALGGDIGVGDTIDKPFSGVAEDPAPLDAFDVADASSAFGS